MCSERNEAREREQSEAVDRIESIMNDERRDGS